MIPLVAMLIIFGLAAKALCIGLLLWSFEEGVTNGWGGQYNGYFRSPSWVRTYLDPNVHRSSLGHSLRIAVHREKQGFAGVWLGFYPVSNGPRQFLDARSYRFLSFWIKGQKGGEDFEMHLADDRSEDREDTIARRPVRAYLARGVTTEWQEVLIPLAEFPGVNFRRLVNLILSFSSPGDYLLYLDDISLKRVGWAALWPPKIREQEGLEAALENVHRAMWVWNIRHLFDRPGEMDRFFRFCARARIREVFVALDLIYRITGTGPGFMLQNPDRYRQFLERAHREGLTVHGLMGNPEWAVRENHLDALDAVEVTLAFNRSMPAGARFDGIHFDVEPNAFIEYADPGFRLQLLRDFLRMMAKSVERVRAEPNLQFGCDVVSWFYQSQETERQDVLLTFNLDEKTVGEHLTDLVDMVTIMDYRNQAGGANGIIASALPALSYAASRGKKILVGLDTFAEPDQTVYFVGSLPLGEFHSRLAASGLRTRLFVRDFRLFTFSHTGHVHVGLVAPAKLEGAMRAAFEKALIDLGLQLGVGWGADGVAAQPLYEEARAALRREPEWEGFETFELKEPKSRSTIQGFRTVHRASTRTTFHGLGRKTFVEETRSVVEWVSRYPSFGGFAFHHYDSFRNLIEGQ